MPDPQTADFADLHESGQDFGDFYPTGHLLVAFPDHAAAEAARKSILENGWSKPDCRIFTDRTVLEGTQRGLDSAGIFSSIGATLKMVQLHHDLAAKGCHFLLIHAEDDDVTEEAMQLIRRGPFELAQKYHRLTIETLQ